MGNAECQGKRHEANDPSLKFRTPHSALPYAKARPGELERASMAKLAAAYSPTTSQSQYHRR